MPQQSTMKGTCRPKVLNYITDPTPALRTPAQILLLPFLCGQMDAQKA